MDEQNNFEENHRQLHLHHELAVSEMRAAIDRFLDGLSADDATTLYSMLTGMRDDPAIGAYYAGCVSTLLRVVHKICRTCSSSTHETHEHITATSLMSSEKESEQ